MKFTTTIQALKILLKTVKPVVGKDGITAFVKLGARAQALTATATNLKAYISQATTSVDIEEPGCCLVAHKQLTRILSKLRVGNIRLIISEDSCNKLYLYIANTKYILLGADPEELPLQTVTEPEKSFTLPANYLHSMLTKVVPFLGKDDGSGYTLGGVSFTVGMETKSLRMLSTDGCCATSIAETVKINASVGADEQTVIIPGFVCKALMNLSRKLEGACYVSFSSRMVTFQFDFNAVIVRTGILDGMFPQVDNAVSEKTDMNLIYVDRKEMIQALEAILTVEPSYNTCTMLVKSGLNVHARIQFIGENVIQGNVEYDVGFFSNKTMPDAIEKIYFNAVYLKTALETLTQVKVIEFGYQKDKPLMLFANNYFFLQMLCAGSFDQTEEEK